MRLTRAELAALAVTATLLVFTLGFFAGRGGMASEYGGMQILTTRSDLQEVEDSATVEDTTEDTTLEKVEAEPASVPVITTEAVADGKLDINTASVEALVELPGIGQTLAERIVDYREEHGAFTSVEELLEVYGIGEKKLEGIYEYITVR